MFRFQVKPITDGLSLSFIQRIASRFSFTKIFVLSPFCKRLYCDCITTMAVIVIVVVIVVVIAVVIVDICQRRKTLEVSQSGFVRKDSP